MAVKRDAAPNNEFECGQKLQDTPRSISMVRLIPLLNLLRLHRVIVRVNVLAKWPRDARLDTSLGNYGVDNLQLRVNTVMPRRRFPRMLYRIKLLPISISR